MLTCMDSPFSDLTILVFPRVPLSMVTVQAVLASCVTIRELRISDWSVTGEQFRTVLSRIIETF